MENRKIALSSVLLDNATNSRPVRTSHPAPRLSRPGRSAARQAERGAGRSPGFNLSAPARHSVPNPIHTKTTGGNMTYRVYPDGIVEIIRPAK